MLALLVIGATVLGRLPEALVAVVGIAMAVWIANRPQRGILLAVALVPLDGLRLPLGIGGAVASWKEALALFTVACAVISSRKVARRARPDWFWWLVARAWGDVLDPRGKRYPQQLTAVLNQAPTAPSGRS